MSFKVTCEVVQPARAEDADPPPQIWLRYNFNGESVETGPCPGGEWTEVGAPAAAEDGGEDGGEHSGGEDADADADVVEADVPAAAEEDAAPPGPLDPPANAPCFMYEKTHSISTTDDALDALNENPVVCFLLGTKGATEGDDVPFAQVLHVDLSHFFVDDAPIIAVRSSEVVESYTYEDSSDEEDDAAPSAVPARPSTHALRYVRIRVELTNAPFLSAELTKKHNPLALRVNGALRLPGVRSQAVPLQKYVAPDPHSLLRERCRGAFCVVQPPLPYSGPAPESRRDRAVAALGRASASDARGATASICWHHTAAWLAGAIDRETLEELLSTESLGVEVHDRDLKPSPLGEDDEEEEVDVAMASLASEPECRLDAWSSLTTAPRKHFALVAKAVGYAMENTEEVAQEEVDSLFCAALIGSWRRAGDDHSHGQADVRVDGLLENAAALARAFARNSASKSRPATAQPETSLRPLVDESASVTGRKRRVTPKGGVDDWRLNEAQRLCKEGHYADANSVVGVRVSLARPLRSLKEGCFVDGRLWETVGDQPFGATDPGSQAPFARLAMMFPYGDGGVLRALLSAVDLINQRSLGDAIVGSLQSYALSDEEAIKANTGDLDVVGGFHIIDEDCRMVVLEGLAHSIAEVLESIPRVQLNGGAYRLLADPTVRFTQRLYAAFNLDLKKIRLRDPLQMLAEAPDIYNPTKVSVACFEALDRLVNVRRATSLRELALCKNGGLPETQQLIQVESKFGEAISLEDMDGVSVKERKSMTTNGLETLSLEEEVQTEKVSDRRKAPTDSTAPSHFMESLRHRHVTDWLETRQLENEEAAADYEVRKAATLKRRADDPIPATYVYSGQKLQYTELAKAAQREELSQKKDCVFVRSTRDNFLSLVVPMVDTGRMEKDEALASKRKWMTKSGFAWPQPREPGTWNRHPKNVSESRARELKEEWVEGELFKVDEGRVSEPEKWVSPSDFDTIPTFAREFGGYLKPTYEREYDSSHVGDYTCLPRGHMELTQYDPTTYYKSVHLVADAAAEAKARKEKLHEEWASHVVVDDPSFYVGGFLVKDKVNPCDRCADILRDPPQKKSLLMVRNARLPSGKVTLLRPAPFSIFATGEYNEEKRFDTTLRIYPGELHGKTATGEPLDFQTRIHRDTMRRASEKILCGKTILPVAAHEVYGDPRWHSGGLDLG